MTRRSSLEGCHCTRSSCISLEFDSVLLHAPAELDRAWHASPSSELRASPLPWRTLSVVSIWHIDYTFDTDSIPEHNESITCLIVKSSYQTNDDNEYDHDNNDDDGNRCVRIQRTHVLYSEMNVEGQLLCQEQKNSTLSVETEGNHRHLFNLPLPDNIIFKSNGSFISLAAPIFFSFTQNSVFRSFRCVSLWQIIRWLIIILTDEGAEESSKRSFYSEEEAKETSKDRFFLQSTCFETKEIQWLMTSVDQHGKQSCPDACSNTAHEPVETFITQFIWSIVPLSFRDRSWSEEKRNNIDRHGTSRHSNSFSSSNRHERFRREKSRRERRWANHWRIHWRTRDWDWWRICDVRCECRNRWERKVTAWKDHRREILCTTSGQECRPRNPTEHWPMFDIVPGCSHWVERLTHCIRSVRLFEHLLREAQKRAIWSSRWTGLSNGTLPFDEFAFHYWPTSSILSNH